MRSVELFHAKCESNLSESQDPLRPPCRARLFGGRAKFEAWRDGVPELGGGLSLSHGIIQDKGINGVASLVEHKERFLTRSHASHQEACRWGLAQSRLSVAKNLRSTIVKVSLHLIGEDTRVEFDGFPFGAKEAYTTIRDLQRQNRIGGCRRGGSKSIGECDGKALITGLIHGVLSQANREQE